MYVCMTGKYPFDGTSRDEVFGKIQSGIFDTSPRVMKNASPDCIDLLKQMLVVDRKKRIKTKKCLEHPWFKNQLAKQEGGDEPMDSEIVKSLREFKGSSKLKKAALNVLVKMLKPKDIEHLKGEFMKIDTDNSGFIEYSELEGALRRAEFKLTGEELSKIINELDYAQNQKINYSEFLAATISIQSFLTHDRLEALFKQFDIDETKSITRQNIKDSFTKLGKVITDADIDTIMGQHDSSKDDAISFDEFKQMMLQQIDD
jgi:Ca2+-binding EF-hand superfamily protein